MPFRALFFLFRIPLNMLATIKMLDRTQHTVGNAEVRRAKLWQNGILQTNLFSFAFGERLSVFFLDCQKTNPKTVWTT